MKYKLLTLLILTLFFSCKSFAISCTTSVGTFPYTFSFAFNENDNVVGHTTNWSEQIAVGQYSIIEPCIRTDDMFYSTQFASGLTPSFTDGEGSTWYDIPGNDYLQLTLKVGVYDASMLKTPYHNVPFTDISNRCSARPGACGAQFATTGSRVSMKLRIKKRFIGENMISLPVAFLYGNQPSPGLPPGSPLVQINLTAAMTVPQSCTFDLGNVVEFNFGPIYSQAFVKGGSGQIPAGVNKMVKNFNIDCKGIEAGSLLTMRVEANNFESDYIKSTNSDVGFKVSDGNDKIFTPNDATSIVPLILDDSFKANVILKAWPISTTGNKPAVGELTGEGYLRVDYQ